MLVEQEVSSIVELKSEYALNKVLRNQRKTREKVFILFHSLWDEHCQKLVRAIDDKYVKKTKLYFVDSWSSSYAFVAHEKIMGMITITPTLVTLSLDYPKVEDRLPTIYRVLDVG